MKFKSLVIAAVLSVMSLPALADQLNVPMHHSSIVRLDGVVATVIVGNPMVAEVSVIGGSILVVQGRLFGNTDIIVLDAGGVELANLSVLVTDVWRGSVVLNRGSGAMNYVCAPVCVRALHPGDDQAAMAILAEQTNAIQAVTQRGMMLTAGGE